MLHDWWWWWCRILPVEMRNTWWLCFTRHEGQTHLTVTLCACVETVASPSCNGRAWRTTRGREGPRSGESLPKSPPFLLSLHHFSLFLHSIILAHRCFIVPRTRWSALSSINSRAVNRAEATEHKQLWLTAYKQLALAAFQRLLLMTGSD